jgi:hypothetical protein
MKKLDYPGDRSGVIVVWLIMFLAAARPHVYSYETNWDFRAPEERHVRPQHGTPTEPGALYFL